MKVGQNIRYLRRRSFVHELLGKHEQQSAMFDGGYTSFEDGKPLMYEYTVPSRICHPSASMPLSAILSIIDETTTWASMGEDTHRRPGVSISLDASLVEPDRPAMAGDRLLFASSVQKIGKTLGFATCEVSCVESGRVVARGNHIKLLDMGLVFRILMGETCFPLTLALVRLLASTSPSARPPPQISADDAGRFEELLTPLSTHVAPDGSVFAKFMCLDEHLQETSLMFGGAQAMIHERTGLSAAREMLSVGHPEPWLSAIRVDYLQGAGIGHQLEAHAKCAKLNGWTGATASSQLIRNADGSQQSSKVCSTAHMTIFVP
jgi:acyl-coenzyme A thioesterase PaaI-like protein